MLFSHPKLGSSLRVAGPVSVLDVYPTILDLVGIPIPGEITGQSLASAYTPRPLYLSTVYWWPAAVRAGSYKLVRSSAEEFDGLFNIEVDPQESVDVSLREPAIAGALDSLLLHETARRRKFDPSFDADLSRFRVWLPGSPSRSEGSPSGTSRSPGPAPQSR